MNPAASIHYCAHPMGYACKDCGASAKVGHAVRHTSRCDIAPRRGVFPCWPTADQQVRNDADQADGVPSAVKRAEIDHGLRPKNRVAVTASRVGPYFVQAWEMGRWVHCPGEWASMIDARHHAERAGGVYGETSEFRVVTMADIGRDDRLDRFIMGLKAGHLRRAGVIRLGTALRAAVDDELDHMWRPSKRVARRMTTPERPERDPSPRRGMLRTLALDFPGHDIWSIAKVPKMRPWVAVPRLRLADTASTDGMRRANVVGREFARGDFDYEGADKTGSTGVKLVFTLRQGTVYEVFDRGRIVGPRRVFMIHDGQCWHDLTLREAYDASR